MRFLQTTFPFLLIVLTAALSVLVAGLMLYRGFVSKNWPTTEGKIVSSQSAWVFLGSKSPLRWGVRIKFRYLLNGKQYTGNTYSLHWLYFTKSIPEKIAQAHPPGKIVPVYYDPHFPKISLLDPGPKSLLGYSCFLGFGLFMLWFSMRILLR